MLEKGKQACQVAAALHADKQRLSAELAAAQQSLAEAKVLMAACASACARGGLACPVALQCPALVSGGLFMPGRGFCP